MTSFPASFQPAEEPSRWPRTLGIIAITFGILGALGGLCGIASTLGSSYMQQLAPGGGEGMPPPVSAKMMAVTVVIQTVGVPVAIMLLVGGLRLRKRARKCAGLLAAWAVTKFFVVAAGSFLAYFTIKNQFAAMTVTKGAPSFSPEMVEWMAWGVAGLAFLWGIALPVFIVIWFSRRVIRDEVQSWS